MRWPTTLFILLGAVIGRCSAQFGFGSPAPVPTCTLYKLPDPSEGEKCEITIDWRSRNDKEALATCLEYFPTTFVKGEKVGDKTKCIVSAAYQCKGTSVDSEVILMFDKCYYFPKGTKHPSGYHYGKITEYDSKDTCKGDKGGKLSVFYSSTHAKFVGMKAHRLGIDKIWIGITADGRKIEKEKDGTRMMIHKELWKLVKGDFWDGENLVKMEAGTNGKLKFNPDATHYFMRTRTDYLNNRWQGSFERAKGSTTVAAFVCEFEAHMTAHQQWYCDKLPALGIVAQYDGRNRKKPRCLYVSATSYTFNGNFQDMAKGCKETPTALHSAGMDDGTADPKAYTNLNHKGPLRLAGYYVEKVTQNDKHNQGHKTIPIREKCQGPITNPEDRKSQMMKWRYYDHHEKSQFAGATQLMWKSDYPLNECSDFPGKSTTLGLKYGELIDMPSRVRAPVVCSMTMFQECENRNNPCGKKLECTNQNEFQPNANDATLAGFFTCACPGEGIVHKQNNGNCEWIYYDDYQSKDDACVWLHFTTEDTIAFPKNKEGNLWTFNGGEKNMWKYNDKLDKMIVREGCKMSLWSHGYQLGDNFLLTSYAQYGTHDVPNEERGTLGGEWGGMGASSGQCHC